MIDVAKNLDENETYLMKANFEGENGGLFSLKLKDGKLYIQFGKKDGSDYNPYLGSHEYYTYYPIDEINGRVVDFNVTYYWQNPVPIIIMLKEDGTISAADWNQDKNEFIGDRKIEGLTNIVRIDEVWHTYKMKFGDETHDVPRHALVATDKNGKTKLINAWK